MPRTRYSLAVLAVIGAVGAVGVRGQEKKSPIPPPYEGCSGAVDAYFTDEVWAKVALPKCLTCHKAGGDAEESKLVLRDPQKEQGAARDAATRHNRDALARMAAAKEKDQSRLLLKVVGQLDHGGEDVLPADSAGYRVLQGFVKRVNTPTTNPADLTKIDPAAPPFFAGVVMLDDKRLLRRVTLSLAGRLPTAAEVAAVGKDGLKALPTLLGAVMKEDAFYLRLREGFNDVFLTTGLDGTAETATLAYEHFEKTRLWYQKHDLSAAGDQKAQTQARYKLANDYRQALREEPMRLVEFIVRNDRPFTEVVTADYVMNSPYTARGYSTFDELKPAFKNIEDPFEFVPVKLKALKGRSRQTDQDSATGFYPHAGLLGAFQYLARYPTTETNRNRLRARMYYQHFLGVDVLELAARVSDAAAVQARFEIPTMQAAECVVCHKTLDPVAGLFQDYWKFADQGVYGKRKGGWFTDMFPPGFEGENLPPAERWRSLQWLGERTARDPRFAVAMTEHVYSILTGRKVLLPPKDIDDPLYAAKRRAYAEQRRETERIATKMAGARFNLKVAFEAWVLSDFYRADGPATALADATRKAELDDIGLVRLLSPEQVERKVAAVFGEKWGRLTDQMAMLYGGIDSQEVTERATDPSGAMGAIQRILSNDVACRHVPKDFSRPAAERKLFPFVDPTTRPGTSPESDAAIRKQIVHLHDRILGRADAPTSPDVERTYKLFAGVVADAVGKKGIDGRENYACRREDATIPADPHYTIRAWRA
ncbi:hypothetical protein J0H58_17920, partial [bacterium]|nr:hypothetical protein [bacterium]